MQIITNETETNFEVAVLAPGATKDNTKVTRNAKNQSITISVKTSVKEFITKEYDLNGTRTVKIPESFDKLQTSSIGNGIIYLSFGLAEHITEVKLG